MVADVLSRAVTIGITEETENTVANIVVGHIFKYVCIDLNHQKNTWRKLQRKNFSYRRQDQRKVTKMRCMYEK